MTRRVMFHDSVTDTIERATLTPYPVVAAGANVTITPVTNASGRTTYTVDGVDTSGEYATLAAAIADTSIAAGNVIKTLGYYIKGDTGSATYDVMTSATFGGVPNGKGDHTAANGLVLKLIQNSTFFVCDQYGAADGLESSAAIQACNNACLLSNTANIKATNLIMLCSPKTKDRIILGGTGADRFNIDFSACVIDAIVGGNLNLTTNLVIVRAKNSDVNLPNLTLNKLCPGFHYDSCAGSTLSDGDSDRFVGYGHKQDGAASGNSVLKNASGREWRQSDPQFNLGEASWLYDTVIINCADTVLLGGRIGQARRNIYIGPLATNTRLISVHPFNGNPNYADPGVVLRTNPICVENDSMGKVFLEDVYLDNGYVYDNSSRLQIVGGRHLVLLDRVAMVHPFIKIVAGLDSNDDRFVSTGFRSSIGFYESDLVTDDVNYPWLNANSNLLLRSGSVNNTGGQFNYIVTTTNVEPHFNYVKRGTLPIWHNFVTNQGINPDTDITDWYIGNGVMLSNAAWRTTGQFPIGYGVGAGLPTVVQLTSRTTSVTSNASTGSIQLFSAAGVPTRTSFTVNCSNLSALDTVQISQRNGTNHYQAYVTRVFASSFVVSFQTDEVAVDAPIFNYTIIKGQAS